MKGTLYVNLLGTYVCTSLLWNAQDAVTPTESDTTPPTAMPTTPSGEISSIMELMHRDEEHHCCEEEYQRRLHAMTKQIQLMEQMLKDCSGKDDKKESNPG